MNKQPAKEMPIVKASIRPVAPDVAAYKLILRRVLDNRPSGMRHRLAKALGKNRSFISQMANPNYSTPAPAQHLDVIFELCHFSKTERTEFLAAYVRAHPRRLQVARRPQPTRTITLVVPDLQDAGRNAIVDRIVGDLARQIEILIFGENATSRARRGARLLEHES